MADVRGTSEKDFIHRLGDGRIAPPGYRDITGVTLGDDVINGLAADDLLFGDAGNDQIIGGPGVDQMTGGPGDDPYYVDNAADQVFEDIGGGSDRVLASADYTLAAGQEIEMLTPDAEGVAPVLGTFAINLTGNEFANTIWGNAAANVLHGGAGDDTLYGFDGNDQLIGNDGNDRLQGGNGNDVLIGATGADAMAGNAGDDRFYLDNAADQVFEDIGGGSDRVLASVDYTLAAGQQIEMLTPDAEGVAPVLGTFAINLTGNEFANTIWGNAAANVLHGGAGDDTLYGFDGNDQLIGNDGNDRLQGGNGNDVLIGATGADAMAGNAGDDRFYVDNAADQVFEDIGGGSDRVLASVDYALAAGQEIEMLTPDAEGVAPVLGTFAINLTGNEFANEVWGNAGSNVLAGGAGNDTLYGFDGNDTLDGGAGVDALNGGAGDDAYHVDNAGDRVIEDIGGGNDHVTASVSYALQAGQEIETLVTDDVSGTAAINLAGNEFDNTIFGNAGVNILEGGAGNDFLDGFGIRDFHFESFDILKGGPGDDSYIVDGPGGRVIENAGEGYDQVVALREYVLPAGQEIELLTTEDINGTAQHHLMYGNEFANTIIGNAADNDIRGMSGDDVLRGEDGPDFVAGGEGKDTIDGGGGADTIGYANAAESTSVGYDTVAGFNAAVDRFDLWTGVTGVDPTIASGTLGTATFDADLAAAMSGLLARHAAAFTPDAGTLAGTTFLVVDTNGVAGYQSGADLVVQLTNPTGALATGNFV